MVASATDFEHTITQLIARRPAQEGQAIAWVWRRVLTRILNVLPSSDGLRHLDDNQVRTLGETITRHDYTWTQQYRDEEALNWILFALNNARLVKSRYLNHPVDAYRPSTIPLEDLNRADLAWIEQLAAALTRRAAFIVPRRWQPKKSGTERIALWHFCGFVASAILESHVLVTKLANKLLNCRNHDLTPDGYLALPSPPLAVVRGRHKPNSCSTSKIANKKTPPAAVRYALAPPTQRHLRLLLTALRTGHRGAPGKTTHIFPTRWRSPTWRRSTFPAAWRQFCKALGLQDKAFTRLSPQTRLPYYGRVLAGFEDVPIFLISAISGSVRITPMTEASYARVFVPSSQSRTILAPEDAPAPLRSSRQIRTQKRRARVLKLFDEIETIRSKLYNRKNRSKRGEFADQIAQEIRSLPPAPPALINSQEDVFHLNASWYGKWLVDMLQDDSLRLGSVLTYASAIAMDFPSLYGDAPLSNWSADTWTGALRYVMDQHETDSARTAYKTWFTFLHRSGATSASEVNWYGQELYKRRVMKPTPLIGFDDFDRAWTACDTLPCSQALRRVVQIKMLLGFFLGFRSREATELLVRDAPIMGTHVIEVRSTKTAAGVRDLYPALLVPKRYREILLQWCRDRFRSSQEPEHPIVTDTDDVKDSSTLASLAGLALRMAIDEPVCFHNLRHSFASWFLLRAFVAVDLIKPDPKHDPWATADVFTDPDMGKGIQTLLYGWREPRPGQEHFPHTLMALCRLMGHSSPLTTLRDYCHNLDVITALLARERWRKKPQGGGGGTPWNSQNIDANPTHLGNRTGIHRAAKGSSSSAQHYPVYGSVAEV